jgi:hypothetical protein
MTEHPEVFISAAPSEPIWPRPVVARLMAWEKGPSPRRASKHSLLPHSPKRTQVRLKSLLEHAWLRQV